MEFAQLGSVRYSWWI